MKIVENLSAVALRQLIDGASPTDQAEGADPVDSLLRRFQEQGEQLRAALLRACDHSWKALEVALAGQGWWDRCKGQLVAGEEAAFGDKIQAFLNAAALETVPGQGPDFRRQCLDELRAGRQGGLLGGELHAEELARRVAAVQADPQGQWQPIAQIAEELRQGFPQLSELLASRPTTGQPFLAAAVAYFFRREIEPGAEMPADLKARFESLADVLAHHAARLEELLRVATAPDHGSGVLDIEAEVRGRAEPIPQVGRAVVRLLRKHDLENGVLRLGDALSIASEEARQQIKELAARFHALPEEQRRAPALLNGLGVLQVAAGDLDLGQRDFQAAAACASGQRLLAAVEFNAYQTALERTEAALALSLLQRAATLAPERFAPVPLERYLPERVVGLDCAGVRFVCKHRPSDSRVMVQSLWLEGLTRQGADLMREAQTLAELGHPAILRPLECDYADGARRWPFLVTDAFQGTSLLDHVRRLGPLSPTDLLAVARPVAEALQSAHERGLLHCNLNPSTVLVHKNASGWLVKVTGFGLAPKPAVLYGALTRPPGWAQTFLGSSVSNALSCIAPEQVGLMAGAGLGPHSDIYSFGKTCYFALLGTAEPDDEEKESIPPQWRKLLGHCTARSISRRMASFQAVLKRLTAAPAPAAHPPAVPAREEVPAAPEVKPDPEQAANYISRGMAYRQQGDTHRALLAFSKALQLDPKNAAILIKRGNTHLDRGEFDLATADYSAALKLDPNNPAAFMNRGLANAKKGDFAAVINDCNEAIRLDQKMAAAYSIRGTAYWERGERHRAIADYTLAIRYDADNALAYNGRGLALADEGDLERAINDYNKAIKIDPRLVLAYVNRGNAYRQVKRYDKALVDLTRALKLDPRNALALYNRALTFAASGVHDRAITDFERVLQYDPKFADAAAKREESRQALARAGAVKPPAPSPQDRPAVKPAVPADHPAPRGKPMPAAEARPANPGARPAAAAAEARPGGPGKPTLAPTRKPGDREEEERRQIRAAAYFARGRSLYDQGDYVQATDQFTKALQMDPKDALAYFHRGRAYVAQDEHTEAIADYTDAIRLNPRNSMAYYYRALAHRLAGHHDQALADCTRALKLDPRLALAYHERGLSYAAKGDKERARADHHEAIRLDPTLAKDK